MSLKAQYQSGRAHLKHKPATSMAKKNGLTFSVDLASVIIIEAVSNLSGATQLKDKSLAGYGDDFFIGYELEFRRGTSSSNLTQGERTVVTDSTNLGVFTLNSLSGNLVKGDKFIMTPPGGLSDSWIDANVPIAFAPGSTGSTDEHEILAVTGLCEVELIAECSTVIAATGGTPTLSLGVGGDTAFLIAATTAEDIDADELWFDSTPTTKYGFSGDVKFVFTTNGIDVGYEVANGNTIASGAINFRMRWRPLEPGAFCVVGTGAAGAI